MNPVKPVLLLSGILFLALGTDGGRLPQPVRDDGSLTGGKSAIRPPPSVLPLKPYYNVRSGGTDDIVDHYAIYKSYSKDTKHYGLMATMDVYGFSIKSDQETAAAIWVGNPGDGSQSTQNFILAGWHVKPNLYGDSRTHFFTYWTACAFQETRIAVIDPLSDFGIGQKDGFLATGCFNAACSGFQQQAGSQAFPGAVIDPVSENNGRRQNITIKVYKEDQTGDWWVYYGFNSYPTAVGKFPKSLFTGLADSTVDFAFGGYVINSRTELSAPMGSGSSQAGSAASFSNLQYILQDGSVSVVDGNLPSGDDNRNCYPLTPIVDGKFFYGGPGGCPS